MSSAILHHRDPQLEFLANLGVVGPVFYAVAILALHFLRPQDIVLYGNVMSAYSIGPYGGLSIAAFIGLGLGALALSLGLRRGVRSSRVLLVGAVLVGLFGIGWIMAGIFRFAPDVASIEPLIRGDAPPTTSGIIHGVAGFGSFACIFAGMIVLSRAFKRDDRWRSFGIPSLVFGLLMLVLFAIGLFVLNSPTVVPCCPPGSRAWVGAIEWRGFVGTFVLWLFLTAMRLRSVARDAAR